MNPNVKIIETKVLSNNWYTLKKITFNYLKKNGRHVVLIDSNQNNVVRAKKLGLEALNTNIYSDMSNRKYR